MKKKTETKKLVLAKETVRNLASADAQKAAARGWTAGVTCGFDTCYCWESWDSCGACTSTAC